MTEVQIRVLLTCELNFYRVTMGDAPFNDFLSKKGLSLPSNFMDASLWRLREASKALKSHLRSTTI